MLVEVGAGKLSLEEMEAVLTHAKREPIQGAPPQGLSLVWVEHRESSQRLQPNMTTTTTTTTTSEVREDDRLETDLPID